MTTIRDFLAADHRQCDDYFVTTEQAVADGAWDKADAVFAGFRTAMLRHFFVEESVLFPAFEERTGMRMGPTQVMRAEHAQMRELLGAAGRGLPAGPFERRRRLVPVHSFRSAGDFSDGRSGCAQGAGGQQ